MRVVRDHRSKDTCDSNPGIRRPHYEQREQSPHHKDGKENTPREEETLSTFILHRSEHLRVYDCIIQRGNHFERRESCSFQHPINHFVSPTKNMCCVLFPKPVL